MSEQIILRHKAIWQKKPILRILYIECLGMIHNALPEFNSELRILDSELKVIHR